MSVLISRALAHPCCTRLSSTKKCLSTGVVPLTQTFGFAYIDLSLAARVRSFCKTFETAQPHSSLGLVSATALQLIWLPGVKMKEHGWVRKLLAKPRILNPVSKSTCIHMAPRRLAWHDRICKVTRLGYWLLCSEEWKSSRSTAELWAANIRGMPKFLTTWVEVT